jgi:hypothetical protein
MDLFKKHGPKLALILGSVFIFIIFFNGYRSAGPSRQKFKKLPETEEDLIKPEPEPEVNRLKEISADRRLKKWLAHWSKYQPNLSADSMEGLGESYIDEQEVDMKEYEFMRKGPNTQFYIGAPGGKYQLNPYWKRLYYKKTDSGWQPFYDNGCGAMLYDSSKNRGVVILRCSLFEGIDDAFWLDKDRLVLMGYESVTRQMSIECETVESCVTPSVWIINLKTKTMNQYHGETLKRENCNVDAYIKAKYPELF